MKINRHKNLHPIRNKWDLAHQSKVAYNRSRNRQETFEMIDELDENNDDDDRFECDMGEPRSVCSGSCAEQGQ